MLFIHNNFYVFSLTSHQFLMKLDFVKLEDKQMRSKHDRPIFIVNYSKLWMESLIDFSVFMARANEQFGQRSFNIESIKMRLGGYKRQCRIFRAPGQTFNNGKKRWPFSCVVHWVASADRAPTLINSQPLRKASPLLHSATLPVNGDFVYETASLFKRVLQSQY